ncbi:MAG: large-conductance mechanosensitive channel protein MscL [Caldilineaceae bacterium]|nr:large-conductance mechanosensitive channel protein MscL [Caldilineaceae bacterium]
MLKEFRDFINRGNVMDLAVAVVLGAAFTAIVTSLVDDIIMPLIGIVLGGIDFTGLAIQVGNATLTYGNFIQAIINFLLVAFVVFLIVRAVNRVSGHKEEEAAPAGPTPEEELLTEIRDILRAQNS